MHNPRTPGAGIAGVSIDALGRGNDENIPECGPVHNNYIAGVLDRAADALLGLCRHAEAERLSHRAAALREVAA